MNLSSIKIKYERVSMRVPDFIDSQSEVDYYIYSFLRNILDKINGLILNQIVSDRSMKNIINRCNSSMDSIFEILIKDEEKFIKIGNFITEFIDELLEDLILYEFYESATNIRNIKNGFVIDARQSL